MYNLSVPQSGLRIGQIAQRAAVSVDTIRYYEKLRLLPQAPRSEAGYRLFDVDAIERVRLIKQAQDIGFSLDEIRLLVIGGGLDECRRTRDLLRSKLAETNQRIKVLRTFSRTLSHHLQACEDELALHGAASNCPVIVELSHAAKHKDRR